MSKFMNSDESTKTPYKIYTTSVTSDIFITQDTNVQLYTYKDGKEEGFIQEFKRGDSFTIIGRNQTNTNEFLVKVDDNRFAFITAPNTADAAINGQGTASNAWLNSHPTLQFDPGSDNAKNFNILVAEANDAIALANANTDSDVSLRSRAERWRDEVAQREFTAALPVSISSGTINSSEQIVAYNIPPLSEAKQSFYDKVIGSYGTPPQWTRYVDPRIYMVNLKSPLGTAETVSDYTSKVFGGGSGGITGTIKNAMVAGARSQIQAGLGRRYTTVIISNPTIVEIAPGYIKYSDWISSDPFVSAVENYSESGDVSDLVNLFSNRDSKFYTITPCFINDAKGTSPSHGYISYVNALLYIAAIFTSRAYSSTSDTKPQRHSSGVVIGNMPAALSQRTIPNTGIMYTTVQWEYYDKSSGYINIGGKIIGWNGADSGNSDRFDYINFYLSGSTNANDNFETQVEESTLGNLANTINAALKETAYWTNGNPIAEEAKAAVDKIFNENTLNGVNPLNGVFSLSDMIGGAKLVFPKIITESSYGKSIQCECTFVGVYGDEEALYLNTLVPYFHLLAFILPHQVKSSLEMYTFPFLVKAFCRGLFNVEMGVISSFSVQRGGNDQALWSFNGAAEIITVSFEITPLMTNLVMSSEQDGIKWIVRNKGLQEYMSAVTAFDARNDKYDLGAELWQAWKGRGVVAKVNAWIPSNILDSSVGQWAQSVISTFGQSGGFSGMAEDAVNIVESNVSGFLSGLSF